MTADIGERDAISVVLLPTEADSRVLVEASGAICAQVQGGVTRSEKQLPHITLAQFFAPAAEAENLWQDVQSLCGRATEAASTGLMFLPERTRDNTWVEMSFFQSQALTDVRNAVLATPFAGRFEINNSDPDQFRPHVTLAMYSGKQTPPLDLARFTIFRRVYSGLRLAVGVNGPNLSLAEITNQEER